MKKCLLILIAFTSIALAEPTRVLVFGAKTGWIGQKIVTIFQEGGYEVFCADARLENREAILKEIEQCKPDLIVSAAGVTGRPNVDWCETHKIETVRGNLLGALNLFDIAHEKNIYVINFGTGCIFQYDRTHTMENMNGFKESDIPNFAGSFYSFTKSMLDMLVDSYPNVLNLRLRMPISDDLHPRSFVTKITKYEKVVNIPNSMTILSDLLPVLPALEQQRIVGNLNFVNPGLISHNEILDLYTEIVDPNFTYQNFSMEEHNRVVKAPRSNNCLDTSKLQSLFPHLPNIKDSMREVFKRMKQTLS